MSPFQERVKKLFENQEKLITKTNIPVEESNGWFQRYKNPILTAAHVPVAWRYDLNEKTNPFLLERIGMNAVMNSGAIKWNGKYLLVVRVEGADRKSFLPLPKVLTELIISDFGKNRLPCPKLMNRQQTFTTCALQPTKMVGSTVFFVQREKTKIIPICLQLLQVQELPVQRI